MTLHAYNPITTLGRQSSEDQKFEVSLVYVVMCQKRRGQGGSDVCSPVVSELVRSEGFGGPRSTLAKRMVVRVMMSRNCPECEVQEEEDLGGQMDTEELSAGKAREEDRKCLLWEGTGG